MNLILALALACSTPSEAPTPTAAPASAAPAASHEHDAHEEGAHEEGAHEEGAHDAHHGTTDAATAVPGSYAASITELQTRKANLEKMLAAGELKAVHPEAKVIMDVAVALPGKATDASKATVSLKALDLKTKADELHDQADKGDAAGAKKAFDEVSADIDALAAVTQ